LPAAALALLLEAAFAVLARGLRARPLIRSLIPSAK
jgi:hypothetical protein